MKNVFRSCLLMLCFILASCQYGNMKHKLMRMYGSKMDLNVSGMTKVMPDAKCLDRLVPNGLKLVVYSDTSNCSACYIEHLKLWNDIVAMENSVQGFSVVFIVEARRGEKDVLRQLLERSGLRHSVYIDVDGVFKRENPHMPSESMFHTFLLDENDEVVLVGDPLRNEKVEKLMLDEIKKVK